MALYFDEHSLTSGDNFDLKCEPVDRSEVFWQLSFDIGEVGKRGTDTFQAIIATPEGIRQAVDMYGSQIASRGLIIMSDYKWDDLLNRLRSIVSECDCDTWDKSIPRLQRYFIWEYED